MNLKALVGILLTLFIFSIAGAQSEISVTVSGNKGGNISKSELLNAGGLNITKTNGYSLSTDSSYKIVNFRMTIFPVGKDPIFDMPSYDSKLTDVMIQLIKSAKVGTKIHFESIQIQPMHASNIKSIFMPSLSFTIIPETK
jgi:hypothetical protein